MRLSSAALRQQVKNIELIVLDIDGVLTDGGLFYGPRGESLKRFDVKDGHGIVLAGLVGLRAAVLTGRQSRIVEIRGKELGLSPISQGNRDKLAGLHSLLKEARVPFSRTAYIGDDLNDLAAMKKVHFCACPNDACNEIRRIAHYKAKAVGGHGAVREIIELILKAQGHWKKAIELMSNPASK